MQKNIQIQWLQHFVQVIWHGNYCVNRLTERQLNCEMDDFYLTIQGTGIEIEALYDEQLIVTIEKIRALNIDEKNE